MIHTVFFGTHDLATAILQGLIDAENITVDMVITQPDRPVGRKKVITPPPVKTLALDHNIKVLQPETLKDFPVEQFDTYDVGTLAEYGLMVPENIINAFPKGILNVHPSLLPLYRGATPMQSAIRNGDAETGISIMMLEKSMDTGPVLAQRTFPLAPDTMYTDLHKQVIKTAPSLLVDTLTKYLDGDIIPVPQDNSTATLCSQLTRDDGRVDWTHTAVQIYNQYRAFTPWPGVWTTWGDKRLKLLNISVSDVQIHAGSVAIEDGTLYVGTADGSIKIHELQLEGKNVMDSRTFVNGFGEIDGEKFT